MGRILKILTVFMVFTMFIVFTVLRQEKKSVLGEKDGGGFLWRGEEADREETGGVVRVD